jgi:hypothetical protein
MIRALVLSTILAAAGCGDDAGGLPTLLLIPTSLDFGSVEIGTTAVSATVILTNNGVGRLGTIEIVVEGTGNPQTDAPQDFTVLENPPDQGGCSGAELPKSESCVFSVLFKPTASGTRTATVTLAGVGGTAFLPVTGEVPPSSVATATTGATPTAEATVEATPTAEATPAGT